MTQREFMLAHIRDMQMQARRAERHLQDMEAQAAKLQQDREATTAERDALYTMAAAIGRVLPKEGE